MSAGPYKIIKYIPLQQGLRLSTFTTLNELPAELLCIFHYNKD